MKEKKKTKISTNTIRIPLWLILIGLLSFCVVIARVSVLALSKKIDDIDIQAFASTRTSTTRTLPADRGTIYDINGNVLAKTVPSYTLIAYLSPSRTTDPKKPQHVVDVDYTATELAKVIDVDYETIVKYLSKTNVYQTELGPKTKGLTELQKDAIQDLNLPGIDFLTTQKRYYPYGDFLSYTIGYAKEKTYTDENGQEITTLVGEMGIEKQYDDILRGTDGYTFYQRDRNGYKIAGTKERTVAAVDGQDIYLTIDANVQLFLEKAIQNAKLKKYRWDWYTILVADAKTGAILGSASDPSFDPNKRNITNYMDYNVAYPFEPGSTMKTFTYMAVMENSKYDGNATYKSGTYKTTDGTVIGDWERRGWGNITYDRGFALSSNTGVISLLRKNINQATLKAYFNRLGFGLPTNIELPNEASGKINFNYETEYYNAGFGQGITTTPIQNIKALTSIANDGMLLQPYYVDRIVDSKGNISYKGERKELYQVASTATTDKIKDLMEDVISGNSRTCTGYPYYMKGYDLILKTGSAQVASSSGYDTGEVIKGIAGMFPKDDPEIIFYVAAKKPNDGAGGRVKPMSMVVKEIVTNISSYYDIYDNKEEEIQKVATYTVPSMINKKTSDVQKELSDFGLKTIVIGEGDKIISQYPKTGIVLTKKDMVILVTNDKENIKMPNFKGLSLNETKTILSYLNIKYEIEGNGYVTNQSIKNGTLLEEDMTLKLQLKEYYVQEQEEQDEEKKK